MADINSTNAPPDGGNINDDKSNANPPQNPPDVIDELFKAMKISEHTRTTTSVYKTIDVQIDARMMLIKIIDQAIDIFQKLAHIKECHFSPALFIAYCLECIYAPLTLNDTENIRMSQSLYAKRFTSFRNREQFLNAITWLPIPEFVFECLQGLYPTFDPRRKNVAFIPSFAAFHFAHDYDKIYPVQIFIKLHDIIATSERTATAAEIYAEWLEWSVITGPNDQRITVANLLGTGLNAQDARNYVTDKIKKILDMYIYASATRELVYSPITVTPLLIDTSVYTTMINPYYYLLGADDRNISSTKQMTLEVGHLVKSLFKDSKCIGDYFGLKSGTSLLNHYYAPFCLPTGHLKKTKPITTNMTPTVYAETIGFLPPVANATVHTIPIPANNTQYDRRLYQARTATNGNPTIYQTDFNPALHIVPDVLCFSPWETGPSSMFHPLMNGILISNSEIDGFKVPQPSANINLSEENSYILDSAIPVDMVKVPSLAQNPLPVRFRNNQLPNEFKVNAALYDRTTARQPIFDNSVSGQVPDNLPGFTTINNLVQPSLAYTKYGYSQRIEHQAASIMIPNPAFEALNEQQRAQNAILLSKKDRIAIREEIPSVWTHCPPKIYAWSSYRFIDESDFHASASSDRFYFIMNPRTIYGTEGRLFKSVHPSKLIPK